MVDQTQTPGQLKAINKRKARGEHKDKVVERKLTSKDTRGTLIDPSNAESVYTVSIIERLIQNEEERETMKKVRLQWMKNNGHSTDEAIIESIMNEMNQIVTEYGVCIVDCSTKKFIMAQFYDNEQR